MRLHASTGGQLFEQPDSTGPNVDRYHLLPCGEWHHASGHTRFVTRETRIAIRCK